MTLTTTESILAERHQFQPSMRVSEDAWLFEDYVLSRECYKEDFLEQLASMIFAGPVLEASNGFGSIGARLACARNCDFCILCDSECGRDICEDRRVRAHLPAQRYRIVSELPAGAFELVYSVNVLHEWNNPEGKLRQLFESVKPGGTLVINDLRRDANPFITEYVIREMAGDETLVGRHHLNTFLSSLRSAYVPSELALILEKEHLGEFYVAEEEPMTVTAVVRKRD